LLAGSISEIATKKSEFSSFIRDGKITPLINALKKKNSVLND
jgi:ABC-type transporter MlaC component